MDAPRVVRVASRIGALSRELPSPAVAAAALVELGKVVPYDCASIMLLGEARPAVLAKVGYDGMPLETMTEVFVGTRWYQNFWRRPVIPSISTEPDDAFRRDDFYQSYLGPFGLDDGTSVPLTSGARLVGMLNLSATRRVYDVDTCQLINSLGAGLAPIADPLGRAPVASAHPDDGGPIALLRDGRLHRVPGREPPPLPDDPGLFAALRSYPSTVDGPFTFCWPRSGSGDWHRVVVENVALPALAGQWVLVRARWLPPPYGLSARELDVLTGLALGRSNDDLARSLVVSPRTVHSHVLNVLRKTSAGSRTEAAAVAWRERLLCPRPPHSTVAELQPDSR